MKWIVYICIGFFFLQNDSIKQDSVKEIIHPYKMALEIQQKKIANDIDTIRMQLNDLIYKLDSLKQKENGKVKRIP